MSNMTGHEDTKLSMRAAGRCWRTLRSGLNFLRTIGRAQHGGINRLDVKTNPLGYVFFSFLRKPEPKPGQTLPSAPLADWVTPVASLIASGYRKAELNYFEGTDAERFTVRLER